MDATKNWMRSGLMLGVLAAASARPADAQPQDAADPERAAPAGSTADRHRLDVLAIRRLLAQQEDAWAQGDGVAYSETFADDGDLITFNGDHLHSRQGIAAGMQRYFDLYLQDTELLNSSESIRFPFSDVAVIVRTGCVLWDGEPTCREEALSVNTTIALKNRGRWLFTSFQNTRIRPLG